MERLTIKSTATRDVKHFLLSRKAPVSFLKFIVERVRQPVCECLFKWNNFPWHGDKVSQKSTRVEHVPMIRRQVVGEKYSSRTTSHDKVTGCLRNLLKWNNFPWQGDRLSEKIFLFVLITFLSIVNQKDFRLRNDFRILHRVCSVDVKIFQIMELST